MFLLINIHNIQGVSYINAQFLFYVAHPEVMIAVQSWCKI